MFDNSIVWDVFPLHDGSTALGSMNKAVKNDRGYDVPAFAVKQNQQGAWVALVWSKRMQRHIAVDLTIAVGKAEPRVLCYHTGRDAKIAYETIIHTWGDWLLSNG
jgi:hypothetical protein